MCIKVDPYNYIEQIFAEKRAKLKAKRQKGHLSKMHYKCEVKKIDFLLKSGTIIGVRNNKVIRYFVRIANPTAFVKKRQLQKYYHKIFYFCENEITELF